MNLLLRQITVIDPSSARHQQLVDLLLKEGHIYFVPQGESAPEECTTIEATGMCVSPGWIDMRSHSGEPGHEQKETLDTLRQAAAAGGFTHVAVMPNTSPVIDTRESVRFIGQPDNTSAIQLLPVAAITKHLKGEKLTDMLDLHAAGATAFSDSHTIEQADILLKTLQYLQHRDALLIERSEETSLSLFGQMHEGKQSTIMGLKGMPALSEEIAVKRNINLLRYAGGRLHLSLISTAEAVQAIREAKSEGLQITCDVAAHQLAFTDEDTATLDTNYKVNPPFRSLKHRKALLNGLKDGTIDVVVSDHTPCTPEQKDLEFDLADFGITGLETVFSTLRTYTDLTDGQIIEKISTNPRRILKLPPVTIAEGQPACLSFFYSDKKWTYGESKIYSRSCNSPLLNKALKGQPVGVAHLGRWWVHPTVVI